MKPPATMEMLDHRGILYRFLDGNPESSFLTFKLLPLDMRALDFPHPYDVDIPQARLERVLEEHAVEFGVEIRRAHEAMALR
jgi:hypothetical protein